MKTSNELYQENLKIFQKYVKEYVIEVFNKDGEIDPFVFGMLMKDGQAAYAILDGLADFFGEDGNKDQAAEVIARLCQEIKFLAMGFISEIWIADVPLKPKSVINPDGDLLFNVIEPDANNKNAFEALMINFETHLEEATTIWKILRSKKSVKLEIYIDGEWKPKVVNKEARFNNFIKEDYNELSQQIKDNLKNNLN